MAINRKQKRIDRVYQLMKAEAVDIRRLLLTAICTVCNRAFLKEVNAMNILVRKDFADTMPPAAVSHP